MSRETWNNKVVGHDMVDPEQLLAHGFNWRIHPQYQQKALRGVINDIGFIKSVTVNKRTGRVIDGHLRVTLALRDSIPLIPVEYVDLTEAEEAEALLTLDPIAALAGSDKDNLETLLGQVNTQDQDVLKLLEDTAKDAGVDWAQAESADAEPQIDRAAELLEKWQVQTGDLFQIGEHRLLIGDCTEVINVSKLLGGSKVNLVHADPPYGMGKNEIENDNLYNEKLDLFQMQWFDQCRSFIADNSSIYIWGTAEDLWRLWFGCLSKSERMTIRNEIVWDKGSGQGMGSDAHRMYPTASERCLFFVLGEQGWNNNADNYWDGFTPIVEYLESQRAAMNWSIKDTKRIAGHSEKSGCHWFDKSQWTMPTEEVYNAWKSAANNDAFKKDYDAFKKDYDELKKDYDELKKDFYETRAPFNNTHTLMTDVWRFDTIRGEDRPDHPTPKPVEMMERIFKTSGTDDAVIYSPFLGSGTDIVAGQNCGRKVYGMEKDEKYGAVILERMTTAFPHLKIDKVAMEKLQE